MQDLLLWRYLRQATPISPSILIPLLEQLSHEPLNQRLAFLGEMSRLIRDPDEGVREASVRVLAGATGMLAYQYLLAALKDPQVAVRLAAVEALQQSAVSDPGRWLHALYHPDPLVREHAEEIGAPPGFKRLFADPAWFAGFEAPLAEATVWSTGAELPDDVYYEADSAIANPTPENLAILEGILGRGTGDKPESRTWIANCLSANGREDLVLPVLEAGFSRELAMVSPESLEVAARGLVASGIFDFEYQFAQALDSRYWNEGDQKAFEILASQASDLNTRYWARDRMGPSIMHAVKLGRLARAFAWGVELGKLLTGEVFQMEMLVTEQLGYTRLKEKRLYITPLPILRMERNGQEVVRGLIVHEYGHHLYHTGTEAEAVWAEADKTGLGKLLNLVADEHLERNLRRRSRRYGNLLKTLNAYAFQYNARDVPANALLNYVGPHAAAVLPNLPLKVAAKRGHVVVSSGRFLRLMAEHGHSFTRFMRALRMGTGNRSGDPRVAEALSLFKGQFRKSTMPQLLEIAKRLREIFGDEANILDDFGMDRAMAGDEWESLTHGGGINADSLRQAVDGLLSGGRQGPEKRPARGDPGTFGLNRRPEETFRLITKIVKVHPNPARRAEYNRTVARAARQLRRYFQDLGLGLARDKGRLQGHHLDQTRIRNLVLKGDPRLMIARKMTRLTDLFLGVAIDCSGSMAGNNLVRARTFGILLAEALSGQRGVDLRLFGFTDKVIYDAGDARRCAVESLESSDGNNDAAALWHVYRVARASRRKAKLLVMISDGLPTECTVVALKALVQRLTRWGVCAAQVAVQPLSEICFPHYVLLNDENFDVAVRKFGEVVMRLVGAALGKR
jgi:hypothetical protein